MVPLLRAPTAAESLECAAATHAGALARTSSPSPYDRPRTPAVIEQGLAVAAETEDAGPRGLPPSLRHAAGWRRFGRTIAQEFGGEGAKTAEMLRRDALTWPGARLLQRYLYGDGAERHVVLEKLHAMGRDGNGGDDDPTRLGAFLAASEAALEQGEAAPPMCAARGELMRRLVGWPAVRGGLAERLRLLTSETHPDRDLALRVVDPRIPFQAERSVIQQLCVHLLKVSRDPDQFELPMHPGAGRPYGLELIQIMEVRWGSPARPSAQGADPGHVVDISFPRAVSALADLDARLRADAPLSLAQIKDLRRQGEICCAALPEGYGREARRWREAVQARLQRVARAECAALCASLGAGRRERDAAARWLRVHADLSAVIAIEWATAQALIGFHAAQEQR